MSLVITMTPDEVVSINGEMLIKVTLRGGEIRLIFEGPKEKYVIQSLSRIRKLSEIEEE